MYFKILDRLEIRPDIARVSSLRFLAACFFMAILSTAVRAQNGYFKTDSAYVQGKVLGGKLYDNNRKLLFKKGTITRSYSPNDIIEYGHLKGDVYVTRGVKDGDMINKYFLLRLVDGKSRLYSLRNHGNQRFFIEHDSSLVELDRSSFQDLLADNTIQYSNSSYITSLTRYSKSSLMRAVDLIDRGYKGTFPMTHLGAFAGYESSARHLVDGDLDIDVHTATPIFGLFIEVPFGTSAYWAANIAASYEAFNYEGDQGNGKAYEYYKFNYSSLSLPVLLRYHSTGKLLRPFLEFGISPLFMKQGNNFGLVSNGDSNAVNLSYVEWPSVSNLTAAAIVGVGGEYSVTDRVGAALEVRLTHEMNLVNKSRSLAVVMHIYFSR